MVGLRMPRESFSTSDKRFLIAAAVACLLAGLYVAYFYQDAFPQASLELKLTRQQITEAARVFLEKQKHSTADYRQITLFEPDEQARLFLEREAGLDEANRLMRGEIAVWKWRARWFRPPQEEELVVQLAPDGRLTGFRHVVPEAMPGARLSKAEALALAQAFLGEQTSLPHRPLEEEERERPARLDFHFTWEQEGFRVGEATYRRSVTVQGDRLGGYAEYLHVPEQWRRDFARLRSSNQLYSRVAQALFVVLILAAIGAVVLALRKRQISWRPLLVISAVVGALTVVSEVNALSFFIDDMATSTPYPQMVAFGLLQALGAGVGVFVYVLLAAAAGEPLYRRFFPEKIRLAALFTRAGLRSKEFFLACISGQAFAALHMAFIVAFYLIATRLGAWTPQDVSYSNLLSTALPWLYPLSISTLASVSEEFWFRLLAIPLLLRLTRSRWFAIVAPALLWGFLHANYPQQPGYIRGVEVGLIGVAAGYLMLRFGILATLVWHYTIDAVLIGTFLFQADAWHYRLSGVVVAGLAFVPAGWSLWVYWRKKGFAVAAEITNAGREETAPVVTEPGVETPPGPPLRPRWSRRWLYAAAALALAAGSIWSPVRLGDFLRIGIDRTEAAAVADAWMLDRGLKPGEMQKVVQFQAGLDQAAFEYLRRLEGPRKANEEIRAHTDTGLWRVRYFRPQQKEEWRVFVGQQGRVSRYEHLLEETAVGSRLDAAAAMEVAQSGLQPFAEIDWAGYRLADSSAEERPNRTDHHFVWELQGHSRGEAKVRLSATVTGEELGSWRRYWKLPDEWLREFERPRLQAFILPALLGAVATLMVVFLVRRLSGRGMPGHHFHWRIYAAGALALGIVYGAQGLNQFTVRMGSYNTATPLENHLAQWVVQWGLMSLLTGVLGGLLLLAADVFLQAVDGRRRMAVPSLATAAALSALLWGILRALSALAGLVPGERYAASTPDISAAEGWVPALQPLAEGVTAAVLLAALAAVVSSAYRLLDRRLSLALCGLLLATAALGRASGWQQWCFNVFEGAVLVGVAFLVARTCAADWVSIGVAVFWVVTFTNASELFLYCEGVLRWHGVAAFGCALMLGWMAILRAAAQENAAAENAAAV